MGSGGEGDLFVFRQDECKLGGCDDSILNLGL